MTSDSSGVITATIRRSGRSGVHMGSKLRLLLIALLFLVVTDVDVRCISTANAQAPSPETAQAALKNFTSFLPDEADALNKVLANWTSGGSNKQLSSILGWSSQQHPCDNSNVTNYKNDTFYGGAWRGVSCTPLLLHTNSTGNYYNVSVRYLRLLGSNMSCDSEFETSDQCGFEGIQGVLPSEIALLTNLEGLSIRYHPNLTGEVPLQIWQMPKLRTLYLSNNDLQGPLPSNTSKHSSSLYAIYLDNNSFTGMLEVSPNGILFSSSLSFLNLKYNQMYGPVDFQRFKTSNDQVIGTIDLSHNYFNGTFSTGPYFNPENLQLSNNLFTSIQFSNYTGNDAYGSRYMPNLTSLNASDNQFSGLFLEEISRLPNLQLLALSGNQINGSFPTEILADMTSLVHLDVSRNNLSGVLDFRHTTKNTSDLIPRLEILFVSDYLVFVIMIFH